MTNPSGERPIVGAMTSQANDQAGQAAPGRCLSRRDAIRLLLAAGAGAAGLALACSPRVARADTSSDLAGAEAELAEAQAQLDAIAADYEALSVAHAETLGRIDDLQADIDALQEDIDERQAELEEKQEVLASRVASVYKGGNVDLLNILLESSSFDELTSNIYYFNKISESDAALIEDVRSAKEELEAQQAELEAEQDELEQLSADEQAQLDEMQANQQQVQDVVNGLDSEVRDLMAQRDAELAASVQEAASAGGSGGGGGGSHVSNPPASGSGSLAAVVSACHSTPSPGLGWCAAWVSNVFSNAGLGYVGGNACDMYAAWCTSSNRANLAAGMIVAVSTHPHTTAGQIYGHVGIYVGGGTVMDNVGYIRSISIDEWASYYGATVPARWGWLGGIVLS